MCACMGKKCSEQSEANKFYSSFCSIKLTKVPSQTVLVRNLVNNPDYNCFQQRIVEKPCLLTLIAIVLLLLQESYLFLQSGASPPGFKKPSERVVSKD